MICPYTEVAGFSIPFLRSITAGNAIKSEIMFSGPIERASKGGGGGYLDAVPNYSQLFS
jgi:hypothetical protein